MSITTDTITVEQLDEMLTAIVPCQWLKGCDSEADYVLVLQCKCDPLLCAPHFASDWSFVQRAQKARQTVKCLRCNAEFPASDVTYRPI